MISRRMIAPACAGLALAGAASAMPASAANWAVWTGQDKSAPMAIFTDGSDEPGAILACDSDGRLSALLTLEPAPVQDIHKRSAAYARTTEGIVTVGGGEPASGKFRYTPVNKSIETKSHAIAAKVFNAAVLGEPLKVETSREGTVETTLPAPNEAFKAFAKTCNSLRAAQES